jgi:ATP-dependent helicase/nuclease subunit A
MNPVKSSAELDAQDRQVRARIESELEKNFLVEAAAGTGKTTSLVNRMVALVSTGKCQVQQLAAITFTRKAAAELRERFQGELRRLAVASKPDQQSLPGIAQQRIALAADQANQSFVGTIHSFCSKLLRERPIEFAVDPEFRELEASEDVLLRQQAWQENIADLIATDDPLMSQLQDLGIDRSQLKICFDQFIEYRDIEIWPVGEVPEYDVESLKEATKGYISHMRTLLPHFPKDRGTDQLMNHYETIVRASDNSWNRQGRFFELLERFDRGSGTTQKNWPKIPGSDKLGKAEDIRWTTFREQLVKPALNFWRRKRYGFVIEFVRRAVSIYERLKRACGGLDFQDLLITVTNGLRHRAELRHYFQQRFPFLLVDEFQDTDPIQAEMMLLLTASDHTQQNWINCIPRPGSLFLVGDPKQSIYRFRRGDIVTYSRVKSILNNSAGEVLPLIKNFRSRDSLIQWNNQVYRHKFAEANKYSPPAEDMILGREESAVPTGQYEDGTLEGIYQLSLPNSRSDTIADTSYEEADRIAAFIRQAIDSGMQIHRTGKELERGLSCTVQASDFMIIPWGKKRIDTYVQALERYGLPYEVSGGNSLSNNQQLTWLIDCLRAVDDPHDPLSYLSLLRDLFGFSDADLFEFKRCGGHFNYAAELPGQLDSALLTRLNAVSSRFQKFRMWIRSVPYTVAVTQIAEELGLLASAAAMPEGNTQSGGLFKAIEWLRQRSWDFDSASDLIHCLEEIREADESESCTALSPDSNLVRVMNLHKAKGLEAPIVFLADTARRFTGQIRCHIDRTSDQPSGYVGITAAKGQYHTTEVATPERWSELQQEEQKFLDAELDRLLYVATTRAAHALVISVGKEDSNWSSLYPFLDQAAPLPLTRPAPQPQPDSADFAHTDNLKPELKKVALASSDKWLAALVPSYEIRTAKELGLHGKPRPSWKASGDYGYQWGSALHELLEICDKRPGQQLRPIAIQLISQHGLASDRLEELLSTAEAVTKSTIWQRAQKSVERFSELPIEFFEATEGQSASLKRLVRGVIDLIFREAEGWVIVDYKTDDLSLADLPHAIDVYRGQLLEYARIWRACTGQPVKTLGLYFSRLNRYEEFAVE